MKATMIHAPGDIRLQELPTPGIENPTDVLCSLVATCVCGSDLWHYRGINQAKDKPWDIGHEYLGRVVETGSQVKDLKVGDLVIIPFLYSCGQCVNCDRDLQSSCENGGGHPGCQAEYLLVHEADGTAVKVPENIDSAFIPSLLTLSDVMATGYHCAVSAGVKPGDSVAVIGDGAVGLCAVIGAKMLGATTIIAASRHGDRQVLATEFGATHIVSARGEDGIGEIRAITAGIGVDCALECVGTQSSWDMALGAVRPGGGIGYVGIPHDINLPMVKMFLENISISGGMAPARTYIPTLLSAVLAGEIVPGKVFDLQLPLAEVARAYEAMDKRQAIKVLLHP